MKKQLQCPYCGHKWKYGFWEWVLKSPFHWFDWRKCRDLRYTKCPACKMRTWMFRQ